MKEIKFDLEKCLGCNLCIFACPLEVLEKKDGRVSLKPGCSLCGICIEACPQGVIRIE